MRSLYRRLHRRFGRRLSGSERVRRAEAHRRRIEGFLPLNLMTRAVDEPPRPRFRVAVIGGGFAGLAAARGLQNLGATVTLFEARAEVGGRVESDRTFIAHRILEKGAELIGSNHPQWLLLALDLGLGLSVITEDDEYEGARLAQPIRFAGRHLTPAEIARLKAELDRAIADLNRRAAVITDPYNPWMAPGAAALDVSPLQGWITRITTDPLARAALEFEFGNDNAVPAPRQSLLAVLTQIAGGGLADYWEDTEVYRCENGNDALAQELVMRLGRASPPVTIRRSEIVEDVNIVGSEVEVTSSWLDTSSGTRSVSRRRTSRHDYAVIAVPPSVWSSIRMGGDPIPIPPIQTGPAVKYLTETAARYWVRRANAPSGVADDLGLLWEGTDNQMGATGIDLTIFAGGPWASRVTAPANAYFDPKIEALLPGYSGASRGRSQFANWPGVNFIRTGYSCPAPGEVMTLLLRMQQSIRDRVFFAGEHVSPPFFGYMEGALQSGLAAASRIGVAAGVALPAYIGTFSGGGVRLQTPPTAAGIRARPP